MQKLLPQNREIDSCYKKKFSQNTGIPPYQRCDFSFENKQLINPEEKKGEKLYQVQYAVNKTIRKLETGTLRSWKRSLEDL